MAGVGATATSSVVAANVCFQAVAKESSTADIGRKADRPFRDRNRNVGLLKPMAESGYAVAAFEGTFLLLIIAS